MPVREQLHEVVCALVDDQDAVEILEEDLGKHSASAGSGCGRRAGQGDRQAGAHGPGPCELFSKCAARRADVYYDLEVLEEGRLKGRSVPGDRAAGNDRVLVGEVIRPHGVRGELVVIPHSDVRQRFECGAELLIGDGSRTLVVESSRAHKKSLLVRFEGISDRDQAEAVRGLALYVERSTSPPIKEPDTYLRVRARRLHRRRRRSRGPRRRRADHRRRWRHSARRRMLG